ncbi:MAG: hypothetical protein PHF51_02315 [Candidatus ainarchaeum sp.]|nr:hypothetical protein [Candidatus ainarchaeum sp.]
MEGDESNPVFPRLPSMRSSWPLYAVIALYAAVSLLAVLHHEPWRDEAQAWLIARDAPNPGTVIRLMGYEGTPALWHALLFPLARLGFPFPAAMQALHWLIAVAGVAHFTLYAPFPKAAKILFPFGSYPLFEYAAIARSYVLVVLLLFLLAALFRRRFSSPVAFAALTALLANTAVHGTAIAGAIAALFGLELVFSRDAGGLKKIAAPLLVLALGLSAAVFQVLPPPDLQWWAAQWNTETSEGHLKNVPAVVVNAFIPVSDNRPGFWNTNPQIPQILETGYWWAPVAALLLLAALFLARSRWAFVFFAIAASGLLSIFFLKHFGYFRQHGLLFVSFVFAAWVARVDRGPPLLGSCFPGRLFPGSAERHADTALSLLLVLLLAVQAWGAAIAVYYDWNHDFSASQRAAGFLRENNLTGRDTLVASYPSAMDAAVLALIPDDGFRIYQLEYGAFGSYMVWDTRFQQAMGWDSDRVMRAVDEERARGNYSNVVILACCEGSWQSNPRFMEKYYLAGSWQAIDYGDTMYAYAARRGS